MNNRNAWSSLLIYYFTREICWSLIRHIYAFNRRKLFVPYQRVPNMCSCKEGDNSWLVMNMSAENACYIMLSVHQWHFLSQWLWVTFKTLVLWSVGRRITIITGLLPGNNLQCSLFPWERILQQRILRRILCLIPWMLAFFSSNLKHQIWCFQRTYSSSVSF